jgi:hypothetical protein
MSLKFKVGYNVYLKKYKMDGQFIDKNSDPNKYGNRTMYKFIINKTIGEITDCNEKNTYPYKVKFKNSLNEYTFLEDELESCEIDNWKKRMEELK